MDYKNLLLQFITSISICSDIDEVAQDVISVLSKIDGFKDLTFDNYYEDWEKLPSELGKRGITTLNGIIVDEGEEQE